MITNPFAARTAVLIADNDVVLRSVLRSLFARLDYEVRLAGDGAEAVIEARKGCGVGLVMLDLDMPGGGLTVCRTLRSDPRFASVPIVILTGYTDPAARGDSLAAGATLFLNKPFNPAELLNALAPYLTLGGAARAELARIVAQDRGLRLQDVVVARARIDGIAARMF